MRLQYLAITTLMLVNAAPAQDFYGFAGVLKGQVRSNKNTNIKPTRLVADLKGGVIQLRMPDTAGSCSGDYEFRWEFLDDISRLVPGKQYRFRMRGRRIAGTCEKNTNTAWMSSSNAGSVLAKAQGIQETAALLTVTKSQSSVVGYPRGPNNAADGTISVARGRVGERTQFKFTFDFSSYPYSSASKLCSFEVAYLFRKNAATSSRASNCPALYGLGVNVGMLEYGALENAKTTFLVGFVDNAVTAARGSNCVPASEIRWLVDLRGRMLKKRTGKEFAGEISTFRQRLARIIVEKCNCK